MVSSHFEVTSFAYIIQPFQPTAYCAAFRRQIVFGNVQFLNKSKIKFCNGYWIIKLDYFINFVSLFLSALQDLKKCHWKLSIF